MERTKAWRMGNNRFWGGKMSLAQYKNGDERLPREAVFHIEGGNRSNNKIIL